MFTKGQRERKTLLDLRKKLEWKSRNPVYFDCGRNVLQFISLATFHSRFLHRSTQYTDPLPSFNALKDQNSKAYKSVCYHQ